MQYYDHGMLGATVAMAAGAQRRQGWAVVVLAALAGMFPDWDALSQHASMETYRLGHRAWGHNVFAVTLAGSLLGLVGFLIHRSWTRNRSEQHPDTGPGFWIVLAVLIMWTHPLMDVLYCGPGRSADWPVVLFWPVIRDGFAVPWVSWTDNGATLILALGLTAIAIAPRHAQRWACAALSACVLYVALRGAMSWRGPV